jgi:predicted nucleic acid-binding protein
MAQEQYAHALTRCNYASAKDCADSYLAAFALESELTLVTFDRAAHSKSDHILLLKT